MVFLWYSYEQNTTELKPSSEKNPHAMDFKFKTQSVENTEKYWQHGHFQLMMRSNIFQLASLNKTLNIHEISERLIMSRN